MTTISGACGRDYKSKKAVLEDWNNGKDFIVRDMFSNSYGNHINRQDAENSPGHHSLSVRYKADRSICILVYVKARKVWVAR